MTLLVTSNLHCYKNTKFSGMKTQKTCTFQIINEADKHIKWRKKYRFLLTVITKKQMKVRFLIKIKRQMRERACVKIFTIGEKIIFLKLAITRYYNVDFFYIAGKTTTFFYGFGINCCFLGTNGKFKFNSNQKKNT